MMMWIITVVIIIVAPMLSKVSCHEGMLRSGDVCNLMHSQRRLSMFIPWPLSRGKRFPLPVEQRSRGPRIRVDLFGERKNSVARNQMTFTCTLSLVLVIFISCFLLGSNQVYFGLNDLYKIDLFELVADFLGHNGLFLSYYRCSLMTVIRTRRFPIGPGSHFEIVNTVLV